MQMEASGPVGKTFGGKYRITSELSRGGMGAVYRAEQTSLGREVAVKTILASDDAIANQRFLMEASLTANLNHPNVVRIFDFGRSDDGTLYLVMELLEGLSLDQWLKTNGALAPADALRIIQSLCGAMAEAHEKQIVHRDIKPANIIVNDRPGMGISAKIIDFGLVKPMDKTSGVSQTGMVLGTPMYMSPEQITASGVDDRVDIYALGLTLYTAITGEQPYPDRGFSSLMHAQVNECLPLLSEECEAPGVSPLVDWIVACASSKDPNERFQNAYQMMEAIRIALLYPEAGAVLSIEDGKLVCSDPEISLTADISPKPLVDPQSYVKDGSAISKDFAESLSIRGDFIQTEGSLADGTARQAPVSLQRSTGRSRIQPIWVMILVAVLGLAGWLRMSASGGSVAVLVQSAPEGADVFRDGVLLGSTPFEIFLNREGSTNLTIELGGHASRTMEISGNSPTVMVRLKASPDASESPTIPKEPMQPATDSVAPTPDTVTPTAPASPKVIPPKDKRAVQGEKVIEAPDKPLSPNGTKDPWADKSKATPQPEAPRDPWAD
jgi:serine/threonine protein kinase